MARGVNKVILVGTLGRDPEMRNTQNGGAVANVSIATSENWKDKQTGENQERTEWHRVVFFGRLAEIVGQYLAKGRQVYIEGSLRTNKWQDQSGNDRYTTEIIASEMQMLGGRNDGGSGQGSGGGGFPQDNQGGSMDQSAPPYQQQGQQGQQQQGQQQQAPDQAAASAQQGQGAQNAGFDDFDDDIPF